MEDLGMVVAKTHYGKDKLIVLEIRENTLLVENESESVFEIDKSDVIEYYED